MARKNRPPSPAAELDVAPAPTMTEDQPSSSAEVEDALQIGVTPITYTADGAIRVLGNEPGEVIDSAGLEPVMDAGETPIVPPSDGADLIDKDPHEDDLDLEDEEEAPDTTPPGSLPDLMLGPEDVFDPVPPPYSDAAGRLAAAHVELAELEAYQWRCIEPVEIMGDNGSRRRLEPGESVEGLPDEVLGDLFARDLIKLC